MPFTPQILLVKLILWEYRPSNVMRIVLNNLFNSETLL